jgi:hypothetical protein
MTSVPHRFLPIFFWCGFMLAGLCANVAFWKTVAEVNAQLPEGQKFSWFWWTLGKQIRLWKEHKRLCAESPWRKRLVFCYAMAFVFMILVAGSFPVPPR